MNRVLVFALAAAMGSSSMAFAEESVAQSGSRILQQSEVSQVVALANVTTNSAASVSNRAAGWVEPPGTGKNQTLFAQEGATTLGKSGMSKRTKVMIYAGAAVVFATSVHRSCTAVVWAGQPEIRGSVAIRARSGGNGSGASGSTPAISF
jgi:hypothetical protein